MNIELQGDSQPTVRIDSVKPGQVIKFIHPKLDFEQEESKYWLVTQPRIGTMTPGVTCVNLLNGMLTTLVDEARVTVHECKPLQIIVSPIQPR